MIVTIYKTNKGIQVFLLFIFGFSVVQAQKYNNTLIDYQGEAQSWLATYKVPAVGIGTIRDGVIRHILVFGDLKKNAPAPYNAIFQVASLTKPVTAMLTLKLVSMGNGNWTNLCINTGLIRTLLTTRGTSS